MRWSGYAPPMEEQEKGRYVRLYGTIVGGIVTAVLLLMAGSQIIGYDLYTGEELPSHVAERIQDAADEQEKRRLERIFGEDETGNASQPYSEPESYSDCINDVGISDEDCAEAFPDEAP
jgi:hypothetical protein